MSRYASVDELRVYLSLDASTPDAVFEDVLTDATSILDEQLGFAFGGDDDIAIQWFDVGFTTRLTLPPPGADAIAQISIIAQGSEDSVVLDRDEFTLDDDGMVLTRLDGSGAVQRWPSGRRIVAVTYTATAPPRALSRACLELARDIWRGRQAGSGGTTIGISGSNEIVFARAFTPEIRSLIRSLRRKYGVDTL